MRLLIDEMHSPRVAEALRADGWDAVAVVAESSLRSLSDESLLALAAESGRVIVTEDVGDFARLAAMTIAAGDSHCGIVITIQARFIRRPPAYPNNLIEALRRFLAAPPVDGDTWVWWLE